METYKRNHHQFLYNLVIYFLTSMITFLFFYYPLCLPSITQCISLFFDAKFLFIVVNVIVLILIGESRLTRPCSSTSPKIYDQYVEQSHISRGMGSINNCIANEKEEGFVQNFIIRGNLDHEEHEDKTIKEIRVLATSARQHKKKQSVLRASKSEVWRKSGEIMKTKAHDGKLSHKETGKCERNDTNFPQDDTENILRGVKGSKSEVWGESAKVERERAEEKKVEQLCMPTEELNSRVEAFIAKVNKQRLLEAKLFRDGRISY